jgi:hypothetical protein
MYFKNSFVTGLAGAYLIVIGLFALPHTMWFHAQKILASVSCRAMTQKESDLRTAFQSDAVNLDRANADQTLDELENLIINFKIKFVNQYNPSAVTASIFGLLCSVFYIVGGVEIILFYRQAKKVIYSALAAYVLLFIAIVFSLLDMLGMIRQFSQIVFTLHPWEASAAAIISPIRMLLKPQFIFILAISIFFYILIPLGIIFSLDQTSKTKK